MPGAELKSVKDGAKRGLRSVVEAHLRTELASPSPTALLRLASNDYHSIKKGMQHVDVAKCLLDHGATVDQEMLYQVSRGGFCPLMDLLSEARVGCDIFHAASAGRLDYLQAELSQDPGLALARDESGRTALLYCAASSLGRRDQEVGSWLAASAALLLECGALVDAASHCGGLDEITPLEHVCWTGGNDAIFRLLVERGARPTSRALWAALGHFQRHGDGHYSLADKLLSIGLDANENDGRTLLHAFAAHEDVRGVQWLIEHGADVGAVDDSGKTALHWAARRNAGVSVAGALLAAGASVVALDGDGLSPRDVARVSGRQKMAALLDCAN